MVALALESWQVYALVLYLIPHCFRLKRRIHCSSCTSIIVIVCMQNVQRVCLAFRRALQNPATGTYGTVSPRVYHEDESGAGPYAILISNAILMADLELLSNWLIARQAGVLAHNRAQRPHHTCFSLPVEASLLLKDQLTAMGNCKYAAVRLPQASRRFLFPTIMELQMIGPAST